MGALGHRRLAWGPCACTALLLTVLVSAQPPAWCASVRADGTYGAGTPHSSPFTADVCGPPTNGALRWSWDPYPSPQTIAEGTWTRVGYTLRYRPQSGGAYTLVSLTQPSYTLGFPTSATAFSVRSSPPPGPKMATAYDTAQTPTTGTLGTGASSPWAGPSYTPAAGSNRLAVIVIGMGEPSGAGSATALTLGGQTATAVGATVTDSNWVSVRVFYLKEAQIAAMSGSAMSVTLNTTVDQIGAICFTLTGVDQTTPVSSVQTGAASGTTAQPGTGVTSTSDGLVIAGVMTDAEGGVTVVAPGADDSATLKTSVIASDTIVAAQYRAGTGGSVTPQWTQANEGYAVQAFNVNAVAASDTRGRLVGGDLLNGQLFGRLVQ